MDEETVQRQNALTGLTAEIVSAYVSNNRTQPTEMPTLIAGVHAALYGLGRPSAADETTVEKLTPAQVRKSITHDALISFIDGKPYKTSKRHLTKHGLDGRAYRMRYGLPADYPIVAPSYSETRSALAHSLGLGQKRRKRGDATPPAEEADSQNEARKRSGRGKKAAG